MKRVDLFVIDGQNSFCASGNESPEHTNFFLKGKPRRGELYVEDADKEAVLVSNMIRRLKDPSRGHRIHKIHATLDSHHRNDGMHNTAWKCADGTCPPPFTMVTFDDVKNSVYIPRFPVAIWNGQRVQSKEWALKYTKALEQRGRNVLVLWPVHCPIGYPGANVYEPLAQAYNEWCDATSAYINFVTKGDFPFTEHYSAIEADVPDPQNPATQLNSALVDDAAEADIVVWCGWAGSHCLKFTAMDAVNKFGKTGTNDFLKKSVFLTDASAPVVTPDAGATKMFAKARQDFLDEVKARGATLSTTVDFLSSI